METAIPKRPAVTFGPPRPIMRDAESWTDEPEHDLFLYTRIFPPQWAGHKHARFRLTYRNQSVMSDVFLCGEKPSENDDLGENRESKAGFTSGGKSEGSYSDCAFRCDVMTSLRGDVIIEAYSEVEAVVATAVTTIDAQDFDKLVSF